LRGHSESPFFTGDLILPRVSVTKDVDLTNALSRQGLGGLFDGTITFSGIAESLTQLDSLRQKVSLTVDEQGAEAAGVTALVALRSATTVADDFTVVADRPFLVDL